MPASLLLTPDVDGLDTLPPLTSWSFFVQSKKGEKILFDLGMAPDVTSYTPAVQEIWNYPGVKPEAEKHVAYILKENGIRPVEISSVIWRYER